MRSVDMSPASAERENVEYLAEFLDIYYADEIARIATGEKEGVNSTSIWLIYSCSWTRTLTGNFEGPFRSTCDS